MHRGKALVCLNPKCGGNHYLRNCPKKSDWDKVTIFAAAKEKWKTKASARKAKQAKAVAGQVHMQVSVKDVDAKQWHQEDYLDALAFIQASKGHNAIQQYKQ